jgi:hypothetical protein
LQSPAGRLVKPRANLAGIVGIHPLFPGRNIGTASISRCLSRPARAGAKAPAALSNPQWTSDI